MGKWQIGALVAGVMLVAACVSATPYQAAVDGEAGYRDQQIERSRWSVSFTGNSLTPREKVETYLLYRAAELTEQQGFDHFRVVQRDTDAESRLIPVGFSPSPFYSGFHCDYNFYNRGRRLTRPLYSSRGFARSAFYDPFGYGYGAADYREVTSYEARAEIIMGSGDPPAEDPAYFVAGDVLVNLSGRIERPET